MLKNEPFSIEYSSRRQNEKTMNKDINKKHPKNKLKSMTYLLSFVNSTKNNL